MDDATIARIADKVMARLQAEPPAATPRRAAASGLGVFPDVKRAVQAAQEAQQALAEGGLALRANVIRAIRSCGRRNAELFSRLAVEESGLGRVEDKIKKNILAAEATPGLEDLNPHVVTGDNGMTLHELAPWGVIGSIIPCTNSTETIVNNSIGMIAAGNAVVFNPHPLTQAASQTCIRELNLAIVAAGGPGNLVTTVESPTVETAQAIMAHPQVSLLVVTGGPGVVSAAMKSGKKVIAAGPGNPPTLVDETANLAEAARDLIAGHSFDNNIVCICEKELVVVEAVAVRLKEEILKQPVVALNRNQADRLAQKVLEVPGTAQAEGRPHREFVGRDAWVLLDSIGLKADRSVRAILAEVDRDHPLAWTEQLMPVLPMVRAKHFDEALALSLQYERGHRHTATMFSLRIDRLSEAARAFNCSVFVKNGPSYAGLGFGGEGFASFTIAGPTGEGLTSARNFTRVSRCVLVNYFRIV
jgi:acyl-CoA reductase-like NAD-dependent aldehyde dehydrogenase